MGKNLLSFCLHTSSIVSHKELSAENSFFKRFLIKSFAILIVSTSCSTRKIIKLDKR